MKSGIQLKDITIRTTLQPGDMGYVIHLHGKLYKDEYNYGVEFESYVAKGFHEFHQQYDPGTNRVWICEHENKMVGFMLLMNRGQAAQLRYFIILKAYRGIGLGNKLMELYMDFFRTCRYSSSYLWTTDELNTAAHLYKKFGFQLTEQKTSEAFGKPVVENKYELIADTTSNLKIKSLKLEG
jgi:N-acetylglutamate synthase-like GNAT family acetyltransferase